MEKHIRKALEAEHDAREQLRAAQRAARQARDIPLLSERSLAFGEARGILRDIAKGQDEAAVRKAHTKGQPAGYPTRTVELQLNDEAVRKNFGDRLERQGVRLPLTIRRPAGMSYQMRGRQVELRPHVTMTQFMITGRQLRKGTWQITLPARLYSQVITWLLIQCGPMTESNGKPKQQPRKQPERLGPLRQKEVARWGSSPAKGRG